MKKVRIEPGCIACTSCQYIAPEVFEVKNFSTVKKDANLQEHESVIKKAAAACPVQVIKIEE